ncbi:hypothetical protein L0152_25975, partial [bacterium]|nr:hypothetical protein [bacterium]
KAAELYELARSFEPAARAWEKASKYEQAARLWSELGNLQDCLRCLQIHGDPIRLAGYWIDQKNWLAAYEALKNLQRTPSLEFVLSLPARVRRTHGIKAIQLTLQNKFEEAALAWEKAKEFSMAAKLFEQIENWSAAGKNYSRSQNWPEALLSYARASKNAKVSPPAFYQTIGKIMSQDYPRGRETVAELADLLYKNGFIRAARDAYISIGKRGKAGRCAWETGEQELAIRNWILEPDAKETTDYLLQHKLFEPGLQVVTELLEHNKKATGKEVFAIYENLLSEWWRAERNQNTAGSIRELLTHWPFHFSLPFYMEVMEFVGDYDSIYRAFEIEKHTIPKKGWKNLYLAFLEQAKRFEKIDPARAGVRFLVIEHFEEANQCWRKVEVTEMNRFCMESAGLQDKLIEHYEKNNHWIEAAFLYETMVDIDNCVKCYLKAEQPLLGADILAGGRHYEAAYRLYIAAGEEAKAAKMLEKLKRFDEAAKLYEKIGDRASALKCAAKVKPKAKQMEL